MGKWARQTADSGLAESTWLVGLPGELIIWLCSRSRAHSDISMCFALDDGGGESADDDDGSRGAKGLHRAR